MLGGYVSVKAVVIREVFSACLKIFRAVKIDEEAVKKNSKSLFAFYSRAALYFLYKQACP